MIPPLEILLAEACPWATEQQAIILQDGIALSDTQLGDAIKIGILRPGKVRLLRVSQIPSPTTPALVLAMKALNSDANSVRGRTFWYGIYIRADAWADRSIIIHELVHTMQYERLGGIEGFLRPYLSECINPPGYPHGPLEQEAMRVTKSMISN
jgi:hypothetical protein